MNSKALVAIIVVLAIIGGLLFLRNNNDMGSQYGQQNPPPQTEVAPSVVQEAPSEQAMMEDENMENGETAMNEEEMMEDEGMMEGSMEDTVEFQLEAGNFYYDLKELRVTEGDTVKIVLNNVEGTHDWNLDEFDASTEVTTEGQTAEVTFVADQVGTFEYYCSIGNHRALGMVGNLVVEPAQ
jgi:plastocyanin